MTQITSILEPTCGMAAACHKLVNLRACHGMSQSNSILELPGEPSLTAYDNLRSADTHTSS